VRLPEASIVATDISPEALDVARRNDTTGRVEFRLGDLFDPVEGKFDLIVSNPPYVADGAATPNVEAHEPHVALFAGADGLDILRRLLPEAARHLEPGGALLCEIADEQSAAVRELAEPHFEEIEFHADLAGMLRLLEATRSR
jgi:HemK-like putative methylase